MCVAGVHLFRSQRWRLFNFQVARPPGAMSYHRHATKFQIKRRASLRKIQPQIKAEPKRKRHARLKCSYFKFKFKTAWTQAVVAVHGTNQISQPDDFLFRRKTLQPDFPAVFQRL
jgi:hypothetical protein